MDASTLVPANELSRRLHTPFPGESAEYREARRALLTFAFQRLDAALSR